MCLFFFGWFLGCFRMFYLLILGNQQEPTLIWYDLLFRCYPTTHWLGQSDWVTDNFESNRMWLFRMRFGAADCYIGCFFRVPKKGWPNPKLLLRFRNQQNLKSSNIQRCVNAGDFWRGLPWHRHLASSTNRGFSIAIFDYLRFLFWSSSSSSQLWSSAPSPSSHFIRSKNQQQVFYSWLNHQKCVHWIQQVSGAT